ncbi:flavin reductase family protein [uncultured Eubacterium sp.]|uniref:flavin reductase family protein n=1 Tax=uncultured Eubacterium sp. TaxID=165185 RepID=UPI0015A832B3|nr:flavin reductase family protein [uncultured Eubacterium sp.]
MFEEIKFSDVKENVIDLISKQWALVTAGNEEAYNTMTVSWGSVGELWGMDMATVYIRPQRYTDEFLNSNDYFTISFYPEELKQQIHGVCGSKSGRDVNKAQEAGITPVFDEAAPYFAEAKLVLVCRKAAKGCFTPEQFIDNEKIDKWYDGDYHNIYYGEIEKVLIKK